MPTRGQKMLLVKDMNKCFPTVQSQGGGCMSSVVQCLIWVPPKPSETPVWMLRKVGKWGRRDRKARGREADVKALDDGAASCWGPSEKLLRVVEASTTVG